MRNLLVHEYGDIDLTIVAEASTLAVEDFSDYLTSVARWMVETDRSAPAPSPDRFDQAKEKGEQAPGE